MGYIKHHSIVVTGHEWEDEQGFKDSDIREAHQKAVELELIVTDVTGIGLNGVASFMVCPDGGKEGRCPSDEYDERRDAFVNWLRSSSPPEFGWFDWAEISLSGDDRKAELLRNAWDEDALEAED